MWLLSFRWVTDREFERRPGFSGEEGEIEGVASGGRFCVCEKRKRVGCESGVSPERNEREAAGCVPACRSLGR